MQRTTGSVFAALLCLAPAVLTAETQICNNPSITVESADPTLLGAMCEASDRAFDLFESCDLSPPSAVTISVADIEPEPCLGIFHCGEARIEVLSPDMIEERRSETGVFQQIPAPRLFQSVIVHELAHAAMDSTPCPVDNCIATSEYFAYTLQLLDLSDEERASIIESQPVEDRVTHDQINAMVLFMAPDIFVRKVWGHVTDRGGICQQLRAVQDGTVVFDRFHP